jgi:glucose-1-phosphate thymidylyltransferase
MLGIIPAAGAGNRIQPLGFPKELLPVGHRQSESQGLRPRAIMEYTLERMARAEADKICVVVSPEKLDLIRYFGASFNCIPICYVVQPHPHGLCDAIFRAESLVHPAEQVLIGLPDTLWFPEDGLARLPALPERISLLLFQVTDPENFDAVVLDEHGLVVEVQVKAQAPKSTWIWGALRMPGKIFHSLSILWRRTATVPYLGYVLNDYIANGGVVEGFTRGTSYVDVGTIDGFRRALDLLREVHV